MSASSHPLHVVTGAGPVGATIALQLAEQGHPVRLLTRSGSGPEHPLIDRRSVDVSRADLLDEQFEGAVAVHHCIHGSAYRASAWRSELPAAERVVLEAAGRAGAVVIFPESLYSYGPVDVPMTEDLPAQRDARQARDPRRAAPGASRVADPERERGRVRLLRSPRTDRPCG